MKILRLRFRSVSVLVILATLAVVFIFLPPIYQNSQSLSPIDKSPANLPGAQLLQVREAEPEHPEPPALPELPELLGAASGIIGVENPVAPSAGQDNVEDPPGRDQAEVPAPEAPSAPSEEKTNLKMTEPDGGNAIQDENEHDSYVQDYPDYTPAGFVEVGKSVPVAKEGDSTQPKEETHKQTHKLIDKQRGKKPARLKPYLSVRGKDEKASMLPEALRVRALGFPSNSSLREFLMEQDRRVGHVSEECPKLIPDAVDPDNRGMGPPPGLMGFHNLLLDRINNIAYCPVYKAASTSWTITLLEIGGYWIKEFRKNERLQTVVSQVFPRISNFAGPALTRGMTRFMVVRHPFERLLSCYRDKFETAKKTYYYTRYGEKMVRHYREFPKHITAPQLSLLQEQVRAKVKAGVPIHLPGNPFAEPLGPTFYEFVQYVIQAKHDDEHWRPYHDHCSSCFMDYQFILRFENMNEEGKQFIEYLNQTSKLEMRWENPTQGGSTTNNVICSYYSNLNTETINDLIRKYNRDFKLFEYNPDRYLKCANDYQQLQQVTEKPNNNISSSNG